jgi:hypothetical protein
MGCSARKKMVLMLTLNIYQVLFGLFCGVLKRSLKISLLALSCLSVRVFIVDGNDSVITH